MNEKIATRFLSFAEVKALCGLSRTSIYLAEQRGEFPRRYLIGVNRIAWRSDDIEKWFATRPQVSPEIKPRTNIPRANGKHESTTAPIAPMAASDASQTLKKPFGRARTWLDHEDLD